MPSKKTPSEFSKGKGSTNPTDTTASATAAATNSSNPPVTTAAATAATTAAATNSSTPTVPTAAATAATTAAATNSSTPTVPTAAATAATTATIPPVNPATNPANVIPIRNTNPIYNLRYPSELSYVANPDDRPFDNIWKFMSLTKLCESVSGNTMNKILLLRVLYMMKASRGTENVFRMLFCMDPFSRKTNICAFLIGHGQNLNLFSGNATMRDSKSGCGKFVMSNDVFLLLSVITHKLTSHVQPFLQILEV
jgi:hypothetical protein